MIQEFEITYRGKRRKEESKEQTQTLQYLSLCLSLCLCLSLSHTLRCVCVCVMQNITAKMSKMRRLGFEQNKIREEHYT